MRFKRRIKDIGILINIKIVENFNDNNINLDDDEEILEK